MGTGLSLLFPSLAVIVIERTRDSRRGVALGAFTSFWDLGIAVGAPLSGLIANLTNYTDIYYVMAVCAVGSALLAAPEQLRRRSAPASASAPTGPEAEDEVVPADSGEPRP
jgi:MFS family permease